MPEREELTDDSDARSIESASDAEAEAPLLERPRDAPFADFCNIYLTDLIAMLQAARSAARESSAAHLLQVVEFEQWARFVYHHS